MVGSEGADFLSGQIGNDTLIADSADTLAGGTGFDVVVADASTAAGGYTLTITALQGLESVRGNAGGTPSMPPQS